MKEKGQAWAVTLCGNKLVLFQKDFTDYFTFDSAIIYPLYQVNVEVLFFLGALDFLGALYFAP